MKIIVWRSPKIFRGLLRAIFRVKTEKEAKIAGLRAGIFFCPADKIGSDDKSDER